MQPLLEITSGDLARSLRNSGRTKTFKSGEEIFREGAAADFLPIVLTGKVKMVSFPEAGKELIVGVFGQGEMFAVPPVFDGAPYPASAVAMEKTTILLIRRADFLRLLGESSEFSFAVINWMCEMLRVKTAAIQNLATASPELRVGNVLLRLTKNETAKIEPMTIALRRQDIAEMARLTVETTIRAVRRLAAKNLIKIERGKIIVEDLAPLREFLVR